MFRIRFHGRGGQGIKTASRILGTAFFLEGFEVQDAPLYGAERRGAPMFAYVRAAREPINERGIVNHPDLVIVADETLVPVPAAGVLKGISATTALLINSNETPETWGNRLKLSGTVLTQFLAEEESICQKMPLAAAACAGSAVALVGVISRESLREAVRQEVAEFGEKAIHRNLERALEAYDQSKPHAGIVKEGVPDRAEGYTSPDWIDPPFDEAGISAPAIHAAATSTEVRTGLWRTLRPVIDYQRCHRCWWVCSTFCPDSAINVDEDYFPRIDYDHCKGCMVCVVQCPSHAIEARSEQEAQAEEAKERMA